MNRKADPLFAFSEEECEYLKEGLKAEEALLSPFATRDDQAIYEHPVSDESQDILIRPNFTRDVDRILNNAFYNRCMDKTQVFPFY